MKTQITDIQGLILLFEHLEQTYYVELISILYELMSEYSSHTLTETHRHTTVCQIKQDNAIQIVYLKSISHNVDYAIFCCPFLFPTRDI